MYYLHIDEGINSFGFYIEGIHNIDKDKDIPIIDEDYDTFFENQSNGTQYRLKKDHPQDNKGGLFDYVEEYEQKPIQQDNTQTSIEDRLALVEEMINNMILEDEGGDE